MGYWTAPEAHGKGLATRADMLLSRWALQHAEVIRIEALLDPWNVASRRVGKNSGFQPEGQLQLYVKLNGHRVDALPHSLGATCRLVPRSLTATHARRVDLGHPRPRGARRLGQIPSVAEPLSTRSGARRHTRREAVSCGLPAARRQPRCPVPA
ncbi:MAG: GNAT family N-acetyltransferase [Solirubrobacteraceae bacterium]